MTAQFTEHLQYNGKEHSMCSQPLSDYFLLNKANTEFRCNCSFLWRGYIGSWEILKDHLYLIKIEGILKDGTNASLSTYFPDFPNRVFAHWFSGKIRLPQGQLLKYVHMGFGSKYEVDQFLHIKKGILIKTTEKYNSISKNAATLEGSAIQGTLISSSDLSNKGY